MITPEFAAQLSKAMEAIENSAYLALEAKDRSEEVKRMFTVIEAARVISDACNGSALTFDVDRIVATVNAQTEMRLSLEGSND